MNEGPPRRNEVDLTLEDEQRIIGRLKTIEGLHQLEAADWAERMSEGRATPRDAVVLMARQNRKLIESFCELLGVDYSRPRTPPRQ